MQIIRDYVKNSQACISLRKKYVVEHKRDSFILNVFCTITREKVHGQFSFDVITITGISQLQMIKDWLFQQLQANGDDFILQQNGVPPYWSLEVRKCLNDQLP